MKQNITILSQIIKEIYQIVYVINKSGVYITHSVITDYGALKYQIPKVFVGKSIWDIFPKKIADIYFNFALDTIHKGRCQNIYETYSATGTSYKELFYNEPLKDSRNNIIGVIGKVIDIELIRNKVNLIITPKNLQNNHNFNNTLSEAIFLLKKIEDNPTANNFLLIQKIKNLLKSCCNIIEKDINYASNNKQAH